MQYKNGNITNPKEIFTNAAQYKDANVANFVLALPLEKNRTKEVYNFEM